MNKIRDKINTSHYVSNPISYLLRSDLKVFSITSSSLSLIMISMLSLFECDTRSSSLSLEERYSLTDSGFYLSPLLSYSM